ncbi:MAG: pyridoxal phosphate-dependent aminotransferase, partial [Firmicutes bacterium]|nr:pyridoxal phosphate-dependent aminotransferase [Bacillota bacterium]
RRAQQLAPSPTMAVDAKAKELKAQGRNIINFSAGEPDFDTPEPIRAAGIRAIENGHTRYTAVGGTPELKRAVAARIREDIGLTYAPGEILVSVGAKHSLFNAVMALVDPGDGVLLPVPYWVTYPEQIKLAEGVVQPVPLSAETGWALTAEAVEAALDGRSRGLILNSPSNPTGAVVPPEELARIAEVVRAHDLWVIADEIYARLLYDGARHQSIATFPGLRERTVVINGVSKAYAMTGWRIGYAAGPAEVIAAMTNLQSQSTSNPAAMTQDAAVEALAGPQEAVEAMRREFERRRRVALEGLAGVRGLRAFPPQGAFYLWIDAGEWMGRELRGRPIRNADDLALVLLEEAEVALVPGSGFGVPTYLRMSYATSTANIREGLSRLQAVLGG